MGHYEDEFEFGGTSHFEDEPESLEKIISKLEEQLFEARQKISQVEQMFCELDVLLKHKVEHETIRKIIKIKEL